MYQEVIAFIKKNRSTIISFAGIYLALSIVMNFLSEAVGSETKIFTMGLVSLILGVLIFINRMYFFYRIAGTYRPLNSTFSVSVLETVKIYIRYFLKATLIFFLVMIPLTAIIVFISPESLLINQEMGQPFIFFYIYLMALYQGIYAFLTFNILFVPLINCSTNTLSSAQSILASIKIISFERKTLIRLYSAYYVAMIGIATLISFFTKPTLYFIASIIMLCTEILWSILISWFFIKINLARQSMEEYQSQQLLSGASPSADDNSDNLTSSESGD